MDMQTQASENSEMRYYAFISYSRKDESWAKWLQKKLETYRLPSRLGKDHIGLPKRIFPIFRDMTDLSGTMVEQGLRPALKESRYLIVICSPNSAASQWVDNEVRWFIEMGRQEDIIPFVVDGVPFSREQECFTPAMRGIKPELLGVNVSELGKQGAFLRVVATMLHLRYDEVVNRDRKRRMRNKAIGIVLAMLMAAVCVWEIWYNTEHSKYYSAYVTRYEIPEGIQEMDKEARARCKYSYRITTLRRKVIRMEIVNSVGTVVRPEYWIEQCYPRMDYGYDSTGRLISITNWNTSGTILSTATLFYNLKENQIALDFRDGNNAVSSRPLNDDVIEELNAVNTPAQSSSPIMRITRILKTYDTQGFSSEEYYQRDNLGSPACDSNRVYGKLYNHDDRGLVTSISDLGQSGNVFGTEAITECDYDTNGRPVEIRKCNRFGNCISAQKLTYNEYGNVVQVDVVDADGKPVLRQNFPVTLVISYDNHGFISEIENVDGSGYPVLNNGVYKSSYKYDKNGRVIEVSYFGTDNQPIYNIEEGVACEKWTYDKNGRQIKHLYFDTSGNLCRGKSANDYGQRISYDTNGYMAELCSLGPTGEPAINQEGYACVRYKNDASGRILLRGYYGADGKMIETKDGYAAKDYSYDTLGNITLIRYLDCNMKPCNNTSGVAKIKNSYDNGLMTSQTYYSAVGAPTTDARGCFERRCIYDSFGNMTREEFRSQAGILVNLKGDTYAAREYGYDQEGHLIRTVYLDRNLNPGEDKTGIGVLRAEYSNGDLVSIWAFDKNEKPHPIAEEIYKICYKYNAQHERISISYYGAEYQPILFDGKYFEERLEYDTSGNVAQKSYWGADGNAVYNFHGFSVVAYTYDRIGNQISESYFDTDGTPICSSAGYYKKQNTYDDAGNLISTQQWSLVPGTNLEERKTVDSKLRPVSICYFDANGTPAVGSAGYHELRITYNGESYYPLSESYYDAMGNPVCQEAGYHKIRYKYDSEDRQISSIRYGTDGLPLPNDDGSFEVQTMYSDNGKIEMISYFGASGEPVTVSHGYHKVHFFWDDAGRVVEFWYLDEQGRFIRPGEWVCNICRISYRSESNQKIYRYFNRNLDDTEVFLFGSCFTYDENGNELSKVSVDEYGNPISK